MKLSPNTKWEKGMDTFTYGQKRGSIFQRYFQNDLEDFGRFDSEGAVESGRSLASLELAEWEGTGAEFYQKFAGDPNCGGMYSRN